MKTKKLLSALMAVCMTAALSLPVFALEADVPQEVTTPSTDGQTGTTTTLTGHIKVTQLKVSVPTKVAFEIDPNKDITTENPKSQMGEQATSKIVNKSMVPVYAKVGSVTVGGGVTLVNTKEALLTADKNVMVSYKQKGSVTTLSNTADWLTTDGVASSVYALTSASGKVDASDGSTDPSVELEVCALTKRGWKANDSFEVKPVIVISATEFS